MMEEMNEINEFMEKMETTSVETKWGHSYDSSLKDKVKITILASGFGVKDINSEEMNERLRQQDENQLRIAAEEAEKEAEKATRRTAYYGQMKGGNIKRPIYSFIFRDEELDNDDIISSVETSPTYKRTKGMTDKFRASAEVVEHAPEPGETITFNFAE